MEKTGLPMSGGSRATVGVPSEVKLCNLMS